MKRTLPSVLAVLCLAACGRTELEWNQKVREVEALSDRVAKQNLERAKFDEDLAKLQEENAGLKAELAAQGPSGRGATQACIEQTRSERVAAEQIKIKADLLRNRLEALATDGLTVSLRKGLLTITLPSSMLFEGKNTDLTPKGRKALRSIAEAVLADDRLLTRFFLVAGHEVPGKREEGAIARSLTRAQAVREHLVGRNGGLPPARWSAAGRGVVDPIVGDDKPDEAQKNQRIEIQMLPDQGELLGVPASTAAPAGTPSMPAPAGTPPMPPPAPTPTTPPPAPTPSTPPPAPTPTTPAPAPTPTTPAPAPTSPP